MGDHEKIKAPDSSGWELRLNGTQRLKDCVT